MFIRNVYMDGFKCYFDAVTIKNIDRSFTAITGMNGSGKSNIIDAIVFALDLSTSKYMRVQNLKELINIGRKECTVTLFFDNTEKKTSPAGYETYDTIEVSRSLDHEGKSKYKLNGHNATKGSIESLCKSIGITNNFVVLQGQITKIVNMKNSDLKNMIEETAGTRNYSQEREKSLSLLEKKELKLREVREHLQKTISPFFEQLKKEKRIYDENKELEINRVGYIQELQELEQLVFVNELKEVINGLISTSTQYITEACELTEIENKTVESQNVNNNINFNLQLNEARNKLEDMKMQNIDEILAEKLKEKDAIAYEYARLSDMQNQVSLAELKDQENILMRDLMADSNTCKLNDLETTNEQMNKAEQRLKILNVKVKNARGVIAKLKHLKIFDGENITNESQIKNFITFLEEQQDNKEKMERIDESITQMKSKIVYPVIDGVFGTVDENFEIIDKRYEEAILTILGGRAKFIICRDENIASEVLKSSDRKVSCIPISKIVFSEPISVPYSCINALHAIRYDKRYEKAFKHIFSGFYIFENSEEAYKCCYACKTVCVTLDGTVYDPKGTLTGGKSNFKFSITKMADIVKLQYEYDSLKAQSLSDDILLNLRSAISDFEEREQCEQAYNKLKSKSEMLEKLFTANIDVKKELENIRAKIIQVNKEGKTRMDTEKKLAVLNGEIKELNTKKCSLNEQEERLIEQIRVLEREKKKWEEAEQHRKMSLKMASVYEEKRKNLIKSKVKLASKISKLHEEAKELLVKVGKVLEKTQDDDQSLLSQEKCVFLNEQFNIEPELFKLNFNSVPDINRTECENRMVLLKEKVGKKRMEINMNPANFELLEKNTLLVQSLEEKIQKLEKDKCEILESIEKINKVGLAENSKAFEHVNKHLKVFLNYFLPGTDILITEDFEIKVKIGNWKNSLGELSGGQKSLIALCLIFSMLTFKPAPFYIFDEIDAALDLNYTQSIGEIIRNEFHGAQFIVISLKNNMFDNANKLFKVVIQDHKPKVITVK